MGGLFARRARAGKIARAPPIGCGSASRIHQAGNPFSICLTLSMNALAAGEGVRPRLVMKP
jgi:hypothetical protein